MSSDIQLQVFMVKWFLASAVWRICGQVLSYLMRMFIFFFRPSICHGRCLLWMLFSVHLLCQISWELSQGIYITSWLCCILLQLETSYWEPPDGCILMLLSSSKREVYLVVCIINQHVLNAEPSLLYISHPLYTNVINFPNFFFNVLLGDHCRHTVTHWNSDSLRSFFFAWTSNLLSILQSSLVSHYCISWDIHCRPTV